MMLWGKEGEPLKLPFYFKSSTCSEYPERNSSQKIPVPMLAVSSLLYSKDKEVQAYPVLQGHSLEIDFEQVLALSNQDKTEQHNSMLLLDYTQYDKLVLQLHLPFIIMWV
jgi:hypothetical protein